jgi:hypothetical protein
MKNPKRQKTRIQRALAVINDFATRELGQPKRKRKERCANGVQRMPDSPKLRALSLYRKQHPSCSLREAAIAAGFNVN